MDFVNVALVWVLPAILINKIVFYLIYKTAGGHECIVDVAYTVSHLVAGIVYCIFATELALDNKLIKILLVTFWAVRLAGFLCYTRVLSGFKDPRYDQVFEAYNSDKFKKDIMVLVQFLFQGLIVFVTSSPLYFLFKNQWSDTGLDIMNYIALALIPFSIVLEGIADWQLESFKRMKKEGVIPSDELLETGLWKKSRHPNLFFDLVTWTCFAIASIDDGYSCLALIGPFALFCVMEFLSTPITDGYMKKKRGQIYDEYCQRTNKYLPF